MDPARHRLGVNLRIERPPFYHLPRSRPVSFEKPTHLRCENNCSSSNPSAGTLSKVCLNQRQQQQQQAETVKMCSCAASPQSSNFANSTSFNSSPKPFSRQDINHDWQQVNEIRRRQLDDQQQQQHHVQYSRLISPTQSATPCECPAAASNGYQSRQNVSSLEHHSTVGSGQRCYGATSSSNSLLKSRGAKEFNDREQMIADNKQPRTDVPDHQEPVVFFRAKPFKLASQEQREFDSNLVKPDSKQEEFMFTRQLERASIAHQTYRTLPIVMPKPKARHDLAIGSYMSLNQDPTWELAHSKPLDKSRDFSKKGEHVRKIQQAIREAQAGGF